MLHLVSLLRTVFLSFSCIRPTYMHYYHIHWRK